MSPRPRQRGGGHEADPAVGTGHHGRTAAQIRQKVHIPLARRARFTRLGHDLNVGNANNDVNDNNADAVNKAGADNIGIS
ncbi:hypothetical protein GCM10017776_41820 [Streptomyces griseoluteus]|nr:hypothetical protein GCM10017776_41820 [Streptomyces griseoluteus]